MLERSESTGREAARAWFWYTRRSRWGRSTARYFRRGLRTCVPRGRRIHTTITRLNSTGLSFATNEKHVFTSVKPLS